MKKDQDKWDLKYDAIQYQRTVCSVLKDHVQFLKEFVPGSALDIACGMGQNSLFLSQQGFTVDSVDISPIALSKFDHPSIHKTQADFDTFRFEENRYDVIVNAYFLERRLFPYIIRGLKPGGVLFFETFLDTKESLSNPDHKLYSQELLHAFLSLDILLFEESEDIAKLIARKK